VTHCVKILPPSPFLKPVPEGTRLPQWALLDVTDEDNWNFNKWYAVGDFPDSEPPVLTRFPATQVCLSLLPPPLAHLPRDRPPPSSGGRSNTGAIVSGVIGGIATIVIAAAAIFYLRRCSQASSAVSTGVSATQPQPPSDEEKLAPSSLSGSPTTTKFYGDPHPQDIPSQIGSGSTLANAALAAPGQEISRPPYSLIFPFKVIRVPDRYHCFFLPFPLLKALFFSCSCKQSLIKMP